MYKELEYKKDLIEASKSWIEPDHLRIVLLSIVYYVINDIEEI